MIKKNNPKYYYQQCQNQSRTLHSFRFLNLIPGMQAPLPMKLGMRRLSSDGVLYLFRQSQVKNHADNGCNEEASLHDKRDGIQETLEGLVVAAIRENLVKVVGDEGGGIAKGETGSEDETVAAIEDHALGDDCHTRYGDGCEEEGGHAAENRGGDGDEGGGEFSEDAHDDEEEAGKGI